MPNTTPAVFVERRCPACNAEEHSIVLQIVVTDFASANPTYDHDRLAELGIALDTLCPIVRCVRCAFMYSPYHLDDESAVFLYEQVIDHDRSREKIYTRWKRMRMLSIWRDLFEFATVNRSDCKLSVLDFGCGWGDFLSVARAPGVNVCGIETDRKKLEWCREQGLNVVSTQAEVDAIAPFDVVFCDQVLEHVNAPLETARLFVACLKPGGVAFVSVPHCTMTELDTASAALSRGELISKDYNPWEHLNYFSPDSLAGMLQTAGFEILNPGATVKRTWYQRLLGSGRHDCARGSLAVSTSLYCRKPLTGSV